MTFSLLITLAVIAVIVGIIIARQRNSQNVVLKGLEEMRTSDWQGWVEITNTDHDNELIMTQLQNLELIDRLGAIIEKAVKPETCLVLNSIDIQHMGTPEGVAQFEELWSAAQQHN